MQINEVCNNFLIYCKEVQNKSPYTIRNYTHYLKRFNEFAGKSHISQLNFEVLSYYRKHMMKQGLSLRTQSYHLLAIRSLLTFCLKTGMEVLDPRRIDLPKYQKPEAQFLTEKQVRKIFQVIDTKFETGIRDMTILQVLFSTGLRVGELARLNWFDIDLKERQFIFLRKGGGKGIAFLSEEAAYWVKEYLDLRKESLDPLFLNYRNVRKEGDPRRLSIVSIQCIVKNYAKKAKIPKVKITPHTIRHSFATNLLEKKVDIRSIQEFLGHKSITTTQMYTHITAFHLKAIHRKCYR